MPDIRELLETAAGEPGAALDLDAVLRRSAQRTRRRRTTVAALCALPVVTGTALLLARPGGGGAQELVPAGPTAGTVAPSTSPAPAVRSPAASPPVQAGPLPPSPTRSGGIPFDAALPDGDTYALLTAVDASGYGLTYDEVTYRGPACLATVPVPTTTGSIAALCFPNTNPRLRHLTAGAATVVVLADSTGEPLRKDFAALRALVRAPGDVPLTARPFRITVAHGTVVRIEGLGYEAA